VRRRRRSSRASSIIDKDTITCLEASYDIYLDDHVCPLDP
jgi:hypothetical protein